MEDFDIKANKVKGLIRSWRAKGINPGDTMKLMLLYLGVDRYLDPETMIYPRKALNRMRKDNGYRDIATMINVIRRSGSFSIIRCKTDDSIVGIIPPTIPFTLTLAEDLYIERPDDTITVRDEKVATRDKSVADRDSQYLITITSEDVKYTSSDNSSDSLNTNLCLNTDCNNHRHRHVEDVPMPKLDKAHFHEKPLPKAVSTVVAYFNVQLKYPNGFKQLIGDFMDLLLYECHQDDYLANKVFIAYLEDRLFPVFTRRIGIENWKMEQIDGWLKSLHQKRLVRVKVSEAIRHYQYRQEHPEEFGDAQKTA